VEAEERSEVLAQVAVGEPVGQETKHDERRQQRLDTGVGEAQSGGALTVDDDGRSDSSEGVFAAPGLVADSLDVQETSVGGEADLPQGGQVAQPFADPEVTGVVDGHFGAEGSTLLVVLLQFGVAVVDVQRRGDALGDDPGAEPSRRPTPARVRI